MKGVEEMKKTILAMLLAGSACANAAGGTAALEKTFWVCDYLSTTYGVHAVPIAACAHVMDEIKRLNHKDDYEGFLRWWRQNKEVEHAKLRGVSGAKRL
jgi:hypothetical protein